MGAARVLEKGSITGGYLLRALEGFLKDICISLDGLLANNENSWFLAMGSSPAPKRSLVILPSPVGFLYLLVGESWTPLGLDMKKALTPIWP